MTPFLFFTICSQLMSPIFKMLSHLMPGLNDPFEKLKCSHWTCWMTFFRNKCCHWMNPIFTNKWPSLDIHPIFVWKEGIYIVAKFCTEIESLTKWPPFFLKTEGFTKRPPSFYSPHQMTPYFSSTSLKDSLFSLLCLSPKDPYFRGLVCTSLSLLYVSAPREITSARLFSA